MLEFKGVHAKILRDRSSERDVEGALSSAKTITCLWDELEQAKRYPGISILIGRWIDDAVTTLLRPEFEKLARLHKTELDWNDKQKFYTTGNESKIFAFGLKTQSSDPEQRYGKIRGLPVSRIFIDQAEQLPADIATELRLRLRPDIEARVTGRDYPRQLTFAANPVNDGAWLAKQFPTTNKIKGRKYYCLSLYDNKHNLPKGFIEDALRTYPPEHPKHRTMILGQRGLNVMGDAVYEKLFDRTHHVGPATFDPKLPLLEAFGFGKHNPLWIAAQRRADGHFVLLGGIIGKHLMLDQFLPYVLPKRADWFEQYSRIETCAAPMGETSSGAARYTMLTLLREAGFKPRWKSTANAPDVQLTMIEHIGAMLGRDAITINKDSSHWLSVSRDDGAKEIPFLAYAFEGGFVWSDHFVSVSNREVRQPFEDDEYANAMHCVENLVLNFCAGQESTDEKTAREDREAADGASFVPPLSAWG